MTSIAIVDYGAGNTVNVQNAFTQLGVSARVSGSERIWKRADALVLPGVGAFGPAMKKLGKQSSSLIDSIREGKPFLGICLGMQLLMERSEESPGVQGLGIVSGAVRRFRTSQPIPQMGWNTVIPRLPCSLLDGIPPFYAYFVHSYYCRPLDRSWVASTTTYGRPFASAFEKKNVFATQFHPEKSGWDGLRVLQNFIREVKK